MDDTLYDQILQFHSSPDGKYPQHVYDILDRGLRGNAKRAFRQGAKPYRAVNGSLFHGEKEVLRRTRMPFILEAFHDNPICFCV